MPPPSYRLDTVCANLIERLEGARPTWIGDAAAAEAGFRRIAEEQVEALQAEHEELLAGSPWGTTLRREVLETFLPRYTRLAVDHNQDEGAGYHAWRRGDPVARALATLAAFFLAAGLYRYTHHPLALAVFALALLVPFVPEIRRSWYRRRYRGLLQEVVDDMARIQDSLDEAPPRALSASMASAERSSSAARDAARTREGQPG
ncbi:hypothetical protein L6R53_03555 [Myxococcota bacterium]|nr:hypothetical protein [Myxococcota bacterium]